ncbi:isopentenyl transferase family protein [Piscinibacterium candidicorallinum]|uniref:Isopentenyl transferase family protein n=1 Tax=Piscinibacterium candidicorallinum TaxID=1793872 RepID=A0ABV7H4M7_9BURK
MKIAVFGPPGGGKSTLSAALAQATGAPLVALDLVQYLPGGGQLSNEAFHARHAEIISQPAWVIDGVGTAQTFPELLRAADVLVYVQRPMLLHYWWVTKRLIKSPFAKPLGWPERSPILRGTLTSYRYLRLSERFWTPAFKGRLRAWQASGEKRVFFIRSQRDAEALLAAVSQGALSSRPASAR